MVLHLVGHRNPVQIPGGDPCLAILAKTARSRFGKRPFSGVYLPYANIWLHRHIKSFLNIETDTQSVSYKVKDTPLRCPALHGQAMPHGQTHSKRSLLKTAVTEAVWPIEAGTQHTAGTAPQSGKPISLTQLSQQGCFTDSVKLSAQPTLLPCGASRMLPDGPLSSRQARYEGW